MPLWNSDPYGWGNQKPNPHGQIDNGTPGLGGTGANPFLDPGQTGYNQQDTQQDLGIGPDGREVYGPSSNGMQRANAMGAYYNKLDNRAAPQLVAQNNADLEASRAQQVQSLGTLQGMAQGNGPSVAGAQTYGALGTNIAAMNAGAQGAGGPAGAMGAGYQAGLGISGQGAQARAGEQAGLMGQYGQGTNQLRAGDVSQYGTDLQQQGRGQGLATQQSILNANSIYNTQNQEQQSELGRESYQQASGQLEKKAQDDSENRFWSTTATAAALAAAAAGAAA